MRLRSAATLFLLFVVAASCDNVITTPDPEGHANSQKRGSGETIDASTVDVRNVDEQTVAIGHSIPSFAGLHLQGDTLVIRSTKTTTAADGKPLITNLLRNLVAPAKYSLVSKIHFLMDVHEVVVEHANYSFVQLYEWKEILRHVPLPEAIAGFGIDHISNTIAIRIVEGTDPVEVLDYLSRLKIPSNAISFKVGPRVRPFINLQAATVDPTMGGIAIETDRDPLVPMQCTLGYNVDAYYSGSWHRAFFTADHCTRSQSSLTGDISQPLVSGGRLIGTEKYALTLSTCGPNGDQLCAEGDAVLVEYAENEDSEHGTILGGVSLGSPDWDGSSVRRILALDTTPIQGQGGQKVGIMTGWTYGIISNSCFDVAPYYPWWDELLSSKLLNIQCLFEVTRPAGVSWNIADSGDSGSPVFAYGYQGNVFAMGILFGGTESGAVTEFWATPITEAMFGPGMPAGISYDFTY